MLAILFALSILVQFEIHDGIVASPDYSNLPNALAPVTAKPCDTSEVMFTVRTQIKGRTYDDAVEIIRNQKPLSIREMKLRTPTVIAVFKDPTEATLMVRTLKLYYKDYFFDIQCVYKGSK